MVSPERDAVIERFLARCGWDNAARAALAGDASARRYERLQSGTATAVLMDSAALPLQVAPFVAIADILAQAGLSVPAVLASHEDEALLLLEDFGDRTFAHLLDQGHDPLPLYELATDALIHLHVRIDGSEAGVQALTRYDDAAWIDIVGLFADDYLPRHGRTPNGAARSAYNDIWRDVLRPLAKLPQSLLLRDFHAGNLFHLPHRDGVAACGLIDFQDAGIGSVLYDLISLLEDARRDLPPDVAHTCRARYLNTQAPLDAAAFDAAWHGLALQRHLRVIAVFDRLAATGDGRYLPHMPRLWRYVGRHLAALPNPDLAEWLHRHLPAQPWT